MARLLISISQIPNSTGPSSLKCKSVKTNFVILTCYQVISWLRKKWIKWASKLWTKPWWIDRFHKSQSVPVPCPIMLHSEQKCAHCGIWNRCILGFVNYRQVSNISCTLAGKNCWSLRCSWSIACRRCSNYIFILDLIPGINSLGKDNCKARRESQKR